MERNLYFNSRKTNRAGSDCPYYYDPKTDTHYEGSWNGMYAFPFGYWPIDSIGHEMFCVGDACYTHVNACGIAAKKYYTSIIMEQIEESVYNLESNLSNFVYELEEYGYTYNEETDFYVSADGSDEFSIDDKVEEISYDVFNVEYDYIKKCVLSCIKDLTYPSEEEITKYLLERLSPYNFDFTTKKGIDIAMKTIDLNFNYYFQLGRKEGRIWPNEKLISFYETEQPNPTELFDILEDLSKCDKIGLTYKEMLNFTIIFEDGNNDWEVTACTISDYIDGNYGLKSYHNYDDEDMEIQYAKDGKTQFVPHLASPEEKMNYFKNFRDIRDQAVYVPREKGASSLARYHAMRYPYGESSNKIGRIIREEINKLMERQK